ncbi:phage tail assembly protein [Sphaerotilaceae bacterium SBD11-9]
MFQTEFEFQLPCGYLDEDGTLHKDGVMRRATAADEILPLKDPRVMKNEAYLVVILLSRVVTRLGGVAAINPKVIESLFATDLAFLQDLYNRVNALDDTGAACPHCGRGPQAEGAEEAPALGERGGVWSATPSLN